MKPYSVRKAGMARGVPHYSAECTLCRSVLAIGHMTREDATIRARTHVALKHPEHGKRGK